MPEAPPPPPPAPFGGGSPWSGGVPQGGGTLGVGLGNPGGGGIYPPDPFPWVDVLPGYEGTPPPGSVNSTANKQGSSLGCPAVGDRKALAYGTTRLVGRTMYAERNDTPSANFAIGFTAGPIEGFTAFWCGGTDVSSMTGFSFASYNGTTPQSADGWLSSVFPGETLAGTAWYRAFVQVTGIIPPGGWKTIIPGGGDGDIEWGADLKGLLLYDPRTSLVGTTASNNPALVIWDLLVRVGGISSALLDPTSFSDAADLCDAMVGSPAAKRFTFDGSFCQETGLDAMLNAVRLCCNGEIYWDNGLIKLWVDVEQPGDPVLTLDDRRNVKDLEYSWLNAADQPTRVIVEYPNASIGYKLDHKTVDNPLLAGGTVDLKTTTLRVEGCVDEVHAGRIATYYLNQATVALRVNCEASFAGIILTRGSKIALTTTDGLSTAEFLVSDVNRKQGGLRALTLRQYDADVYGDAALDGTAPPSVGPPWTDPLLTPPDVLRPRLVGNGLSFEEPRSYEPAVLYNSSHWSLVNVTSPDATKANDGSLASSSGSYGPSATSRWRLDATTPKKFSKLRFDVTEGGGFESFSSYWLSDAPLVSYSDDDSSWTSVTGARASLIRSSTNMLGWIVEWDEPASAHRYWRATVGLGAAGATIFVMEVQFFVASGVAYQWRHHYEIRAGIDASAPLFVTLPVTSLPTASAPLDISAARYVTNVPYTGAGPLLHEIVEYLDLFIVAVNVAGVPSAGVYLFSVRTPVGQTGAVNSLLADYPEHSAGTPAVSAAGRARLIAHSGALRASENGSAYSPILTKGGNTPGVTLQASSPGAADSGNVHVDGIVIPDGGLLTDQAGKVPPWAVRVRCTTTTTINSDTAADVTGATITFTPATDLRCVIAVIADPLCNSTGATLVAEIVVDGGSAEAPQALFNGTASGQRASVAQSLIVDLAGGASHTIKLQARLATGGSGASYDLQPDHTGFTIVAHGAA